MGTVGSFHCSTSNHNGNVVTTTVIILSYKTMLLFLLRCFKYEAQIILKNSVLYRVNIIKIAIL